MERKMKKKAAGGPKPPAQRPGLRPVAENRVASPETVSTVKKVKGERPVSSENLPSFMRPTSNSALRQRSMKERAVFEHKAKAVIPKKKKKKDEATAKKKVIRIPSSYRRVKKSGSMKSMKSMQSLKRMNSIKLLKRALSKGRQGSGELPISTRSSLMSIEEGAEESSKSPSPPPGMYGSDEPPTRMLKHSASSAKRSIGSLVASAAELDKQIVEEHTEGQGFGEEISDSDEDDQFEKTAALNGAFSNAGGSSLVRSRNIRQRETSGSDEERLETCVEDDDINPEVDAVSDVPVIVSDGNDSISALEPHLGSGADPADIVDNTEGVEVCTDSSELNPDAFGSIQLMSSLDSADQSSSVDQAALAQLPKNLEDHATLENTMGNNSDSQEKLTDGNSSCGIDKNSLKADDAEVHSDGLGRKLDLNDPGSESLSLDPAAKIDDESKIQETKEWLSEKDASCRDASSTFEAHTEGLDTLAIRNLEADDAMIESPHGEKSDSNHVTESALDSRHQPDIVLVDNTLSDETPINNGLERMKQVILSSQINGENSEDASEQKDIAGAPVCEASQNGEYQKEDGDSIKPGEYVDFEKHGDNDIAVGRDNDDLVSRAVAYPKGIDDDKDILFGDQQCILDREASPTNPSLHALGAESSLQDSVTNLPPTCGAELEEIDGTLEDENKNMITAQMTSERSKQDEDMALLHNLNSSPDFASDEFSNQEPTTLGFLEHQSPPRTDALVVSDEQLDLIVPDAEDADSWKKDHSPPDSYSGEATVSGQNSSDCKVDLTTDEQLVLHGPLEKQPDSTIDFEPTLNTQLEGPGEVQRLVDNVENTISNRKVSHYRDLDSTTASHSQEVKTSLHEIYSESELRNSGMVQSVAAVAQQSREVMLPFDPPRRRSKEPSRGFWWELGVGIVAGVLTAAWLALSRGCEGCGQDEINDIELEPFLEVAEVSDPVCVAPTLPESMPVPEPLPVSTQVPKKVGNFDRLQEKLLWHSE